VTRMRSARSPLRLRPSVQRQLDDGLQKCAQYSGMGVDSGKARRHWRLASAITAPLLAVGCGGSSGDPGFAVPDAGSLTPVTDDGGDAAIDDSSGFDLDAGQVTIALMGGDGALPPVKFDCEPGTYSGMFVTTVTTDAGLFPSLLHFNWMGNLSITLVGHVMQTQSANGENFTAAPVLTIAPGAMLSGTDNFGGYFSSGLSGQLDCPSKQLTGTLSNGTYEYPGDAGSITMVGMLTGVYDGTMTPPALTMGTIAVGSPMWSTLGATGTWSATLQ
jgi:hypothetical protein